MAKLIAVNGLKGVGRYELLTLIQKLMADNYRGKIVVQKTKDVFDWHLKRSTEAGRRLNKLGKERINCQDLPRDLFLLTCISWIEMNALNGPSTILLLSGFPGNYGQLALMNHFDSSKVIYIEPSEDHKRMIKENRPADWYDFKYSIEPTFAALNGSVLQLKQELPLPDRLQKTVAHLDGVVNPHLTKIVSRRIRDHFPQSTRHPHETTLPVKWST